MHGVQSRTGSIGPDEASQREAPRVRVFIVSDVRLYRETLAALLARDARLQALGEGEPSEATIDDLARLDHDVTLINPTFPGAAEFLLRLRERAPATRIVAFAMFTGSEDLLRIASAGISGCVGREGSAADICEAIVAASRDEFYCSGRIAGALLSGLARRNADAATPRPSGGGLTARERQVLCRIDDGLTNKQIAAELAMSPATVKNHIHRILEKLQVSRRSQAPAAWRNEAARALRPQAG